MWIKTYSKLFKNINSKDIWRIWIDVNNWSKWHGDLDYCKLVGDFKVGNHFVLKPKGAGPVKILITEIIEGRSFTDCTSFFGAKMYDTHAIEETPEGLRLSNKLIVSGPLKWIWILVVARNVAHSVPNEMEALVRLARGRNV